MFKVDFHLSNIVRFLGTHQAGYNSQRPHRSDGQPGRLDPFEARSGQERQRSEHVGRGGDAANSNGIGHGLPFEETAQKLAVDDILHEVGRLRTDNDPE